MSFLVLREVKCHWCDIFFCVCWSCWRGQAYCSDKCRRAGRCHAHRMAQKRYRETAEGKRTHREAERRRRIRRAKKTVDDRGSTPISAGCKIESSDTEPAMKSENSYERVGVGNKGWCHFCGALGTIVNKFARRGYGNKNSRVQRARNRKQYTIRDRR